MKTYKSLLFLAALSPAALFLCSCSKPGVVQQSADDIKGAASNLTREVKAAASDSWDSIKDYTYAKHKDFADSLDRMAAQRDAEIKAMKTESTGKPDGAANHRDAAVKEFNEAVADLKSGLAELRTSTADTWAVTKTKVAQSWERVQTAYDKVKANASS